jgi:porphobilinogen synthase
MFIRAGTNTVQPIGSMPGHAQFTADRLGPDLEALQSLGVPSVLLFGIPAAKDAMGSGAWDANGPVPDAIAEIRRQSPSTTIIADVCLCEYTSHGHCGVLDERTGEVANDATLALLGDAAVAYATAGADIVAPSAMMDGQVAAIRRALDDAGHHDVAIMSYAVKYASAFYGPFREAAESAPAFGDRRAYQMDPANARDALREARLDEEEGADLLMVKPAGPYLDVLQRVRAATALPLAAYQTSGEYAMLKAAAERGWLDEQRAAMESLLGIRRAGADLVITYYAREAARWLRETSR